MDQDKALRIDQLVVEGNEIRETSETGNSNEISALYKAFAEAFAAIATFAVNAPYAPSCVPNIEVRPLNVEEIIQKVMAEHPLKGFEVDIRDSMHNLVMMAHVDNIWEDPATFQQFRMLSELVAMKMKQYERKLYISLGIKYEQVLTADEIEEQLQEGSFTMFSNCDKCGVGNGAGNDRDKE